MTEYTRSKRNRLNPETRDMTSNQLMPKVYKTAEERQDAFETLAIEIMELKDSQGLVMDIYQVHELVNIYKQAEQILEEAEEYLSRS